MKLISIVATFIIFSLLAIIDSAKALQQNQVEATRNIVAKKLETNFQKRLVIENKTAQVFFTVDASRVLQIKKVKKDLAALSKEKLQVIFLSSIKNMAGKTFSIVFNIMVH